MKHNLNVIQIRGIRGIILTVGAICCLAAGFIVFPGWVAMHIWNKFASLTGTIPLIGLIQGTLLWGIIIAAYFTFKKNSLVICVKSPEGLSEEELRSVFENVKGQSREDLIIKSMIKAREAELRLKDKTTDDNCDENCVSDISANGEQK